MTQLLKEPLRRLLMGLSIPGVGFTVASSLSERFECVEHIMFAKVQGLSRIEGISENRAKNILDWFCYPYNIKLLNNLRNEGLYGFGENNANFYSILQLTILRLLQK